MTDYLANGQGASLSQLPEFLTGSLHIIGGGYMGGKATGLMYMHAALSACFRPEQHPGLEVGIPGFVVLGTDVYDRFMEMNLLHEFVETERADNRIANRFLAAQMPPEVLGELWSMMSRVRLPLAVRSSSLLEDAVAAPFAGIYLTKMLPNNDPDPQHRFARLVEAVKLVYASAWFAAARDYQAGIGKRPQEEKMGVIIQDVAGNRFGTRFYPHISGVARTFNYYAHGHCSSGDGVVNLALGLGKTIVEGDPCWSYCPRFPRSVPPSRGIGSLLKESQLKFWAIDLGSRQSSNPMDESEHLIRLDLEDAEYDDVLSHLVSTYDPESDVLRLGMGRAGPRVVNFGPILQARTIPLNDVVLELMALGRRCYDSEVEMELAVALPMARGGKSRVSVLQVRPMVAATDWVEITPAEEASACIRSGQVLGNGRKTGIEHIMFVKRSVFESRHTVKIAEEIRQLNRVADGKPYVLVGYGRFGSADPWLGIPVTWGAISSARVIVEASIPGMNPDPSQGSHFFHNICSFGVGYFTVGDGERDIDWAWLEALETVAETDFVRLARVAAPLEVKVDGRKGAGVILR